MCLFPNLTLERPVTRRGILSSASSLCDLLGFAHGGRLRKRCCYNGCAGLTLSGMAPLIAIVNHGLSCTLSISEQDPPRVPISWFGYSIELLPLIPGIAHSFFIQFHHLTGIPDICQRKSVGFHVNCPWIVPIIVPSEAPSFFSSTLKHSSIPVSSAANFLSQTHFVRTSLSITPFLRSIPAQHRISSRLIHYAFKCTRAHFSWLLNLVAVGPFCNSLRQAIVPDAFKQTVITMLHFSRSIPVFPWWPETVPFLLSILN